MKTLATLLHTLYCVKAHTGSIEEIAKLPELRKNPNVCLFYFEEVIDTAWSCRDHEVWLATAKRFTEENKLNEEQAVQMLTRILIQLQKINELVVTYPNARKLLIELLELND